MLSHCWRECRTGQPLWKVVWHLLAKLNILLPCDLAIVLHSVYPKELETPVRPKQTRHRCL